jgi:hypothetical protein
MQEGVDDYGPFPVYVPRIREGVLAEVLGGSAIVGFPAEADPDHIHIYYEGNWYGSPDLVRFADRVVHAAGRCRWQRLDAERWQREHTNMPRPQTEYGFVGYPTSAQAVVLAEQLVEVAFFDDVLGFVIAIGPDQGRVLGDWIGSNDPLELVASGRVFEERRRAAGLDVL